MEYEQESAWDNMIAEEGRSMYDLEERLLEYSVRIIRLTEQMKPSQAGKHIANQLLRSGTSPLANHGEAQAAESTKDFIHKLKVALKELKEALRWIKLTKRVPLVESLERLDELLNETDQLIRILSSSIRTAQKRLHTT
jgi:four helix bundle protein